MIPTIDIGGRWVPTYFVRRGSADTEGEVADAAQPRRRSRPERGHPDLPGGTRFTPAKLARAKEVIAERQPEVAPLAAQDSRTSCRRASAARWRCSTRRTGVDVVFCGHVGFDGFAARLATSGRRPRRHDDPGPLLAPRGVERPGDRGRADRLALRALAGARRLGRRAARAPPVRSAAERAPPAACRGTRPVTPRNGDRPELSVGIVGAGFGGVGMAIQLKQAGFETSRLRARRHRSAASGARTPIPARPATCPRTSTRSRSRPGRVVAPLRAAGGDPALPRARSPRLRHRAPPAPRHGGRARPSSTSRRGRWTRDHRRGDTKRVDFLVTACGQLTAPVDPGVPGIEDFEGPASTRPSGITTSTLAGKRRRGGRHRRERDPIRARDRAGRRAADDLPALGAVDHPEDGPRLPGVGAARSSSASRPRVAAARPGCSPSSKSSPTASPGGRG